MFQTSQRYDLRKLTGLLAVAAFCLGFWGLVYFIAVTVWDSRVETKLYGPVCRVLIESGWEVPFDDCIAKFKEDPMDNSGSAAERRTSPPDVVIPDVGSDPGSEGVSTAGGH